MTIHGTHAESIDGGLVGYVTDDFRPIPDQLRHVLSRRDGVQRFTYTMWRATNPESIVVRLRDMNEQFIRAAGSAGAMTITVTLPGADGVVRSYTVGRPGPYEGARVQIRVGEQTAVRVFPNEVFTADEAAAIFYTYYLTDTIAQPYQLRETDPADTVRVPLLWTHAESFNGGEYQYLTGDGAPIAKHLAKVLNQADGKRRYTYSIWRMTDPDDLREDDGSFLQAGGSATAMTLEIAFPAADGTRRLCTIGHPDKPTEPTTAIPINSKRAVRVFANEVFTADEAATIFDAYFRTGRIPDGYTLRELDLSHDLSEPR